MAKDLKSIMPCWIWKGGLSIGGMKKCEHRCSKMYVIDVEVEPHLQTLTGKILSSSTNSSDEAHMDISLRGLWQRGQHAFFDVLCIYRPICKEPAKPKTWNRIHFQWEWEKEAGTAISASLWLSMVPSAPSCIHSIAGLEPKSPSTY